MESQHKYNWEKNRFFGLRIRKLRFLNHLRFLKQCRDLGLIPRFIHIRCGLKPTFRIQRVLRGALLSLLRACIQDIRAHIAMIEREMYNLHLFLAGRCSGFLRMEYMSMRRAEYSSSLHRRSLEKKLARLKHVTAVSSRVLYHRYCSTEKRTDTVLMHQHGSSDFDGHVPGIFRRTSVVRDGAGFRHDVGSNMSLVPFSEDLHPSNNCFGIYSTSELPSNVLDPSVHVDDVRTDVLHSCPGNIKNDNFIISFDEFNHITGNNIDFVSLKPVINLSSQVLTIEQERVLELNDNYGISSRIDVPRIVAPIEAAVTYSKLSEYDRDALRFAAAGVLHSYKSGVGRSSNFTFRERQVLRELVNDNNIIICKSDKGGRITVLDKTTYIENISNILHTGPYTKLSCDPSFVELTKVKKCIKESRILSDECKKKILPSVSHTARLYGLPKIHNPDLSFRLIVSGIGTATEKVSKYLASIFSTLTSTNIYTVKNSIEFLNVLRAFQEPCHNLVMVSFDVINMFGNVPIDGALKAVSRKLREFHFTHAEIEEYIRLAGYCLKNQSFAFQHKYYRQNDGMAMGNSLSPIMSDIYMNEFETELLQNFPAKLWIRYVDDIFSLLPTENLDLSDLLQTANSRDPNIQFKCVLENNGILPFLDILVFRRECGFDFTVYHKPFAISLPPHCKSWHPQCQKMSAFRYFVTRALRVCTTPHFLYREIEYIKQVAMNRGFHAGIIEKMVWKYRHKWSGTTLQSLTDQNKPVCGVITLPFIPGLSYRLANILERFNFHVVMKPLKKLRFTILKDPIPENQKWGIYQIKCECELSYIGQTRRNLKYRVVEHRRYVKNFDTEKSSIAQHSRLTGHSFDFDNAVVIRSTDSIFNLNCLEAYYIYVSRRDLVNDVDISPTLALPWRSLVPVGPEIT